MDLTTRAVLVKFTDRCWIGGTIDHQAGKKIEEQTGATTRSGHYWKKLIPKAALNTRVNMGGDARTFHYANTLPWMEGGIRILPIANLQDYLKEMRRRKALADEEVVKFLANYGQWIDEAKRTQGKLFDRSKYPPADQLKDKFGFEIDLLPMPNLKDWRVELDAEQMAELQRQAGQKFASVQEQGIKDLYKRLGKLLKHAKEKLTDPKAIFRDSLIGNIKSMVGLISKLNVTGDQGLEEIRRQVESSLAGLGAETLRRDPAARSKAASNASSIISRMELYMGGAAIPVPAVKIQPRRKLINPQPASIQEALAAKPKRSRK